MESDAYKSLPVTSRSKGTLYLIRGLPGSGKSTLADMLWDYLRNLCKFNVEWVEADMYFIDRNGEYHFDAKYIGQAHDWCQNRVNQAMEDNTPIIIVSNTFTQIWEMQAYLDMAKVRGYTVVVYHCENQFPQQHNVPLATIEKMKQRWEKY